MALAASAPAAIATGSMETNFRELLERERVAPELILFMESQGIYSSKVFANFIENRLEVRTLLVDKVDETNSNRAQTAILTGIWRDAENEADERSKRKATGYSDNDMELPLDEPIIQGLKEKFLSIYSFEFTEAETLWSHLLGRLKREIDRKSHSLIAVARVGSERESGRSEATKRFKLGDGAVMSLSSNSRADREISTNFIYVSLLEILMNGYALVGSFRDLSGERFAPYDDCHRYLAFVRSMATPLCGAWPPLSRIKKADEDTRSLWAARMKKGDTLGQAMKACKSEQDALWLWAVELHTADARRSLQDGDDDEDTGGLMLAPNKKAREGKNRRPVSPTGLPPTSGAAGPKLQKVQKFATTGKNAVRFCVAWNTGSCVSGSRCPKNFQHLCNFIDQSTGKVCNQQHRCKDKH